MTTRVQNNHWSMDAPGEPEELAPPLATVQSTEFGDDDIDDVLSDDNDRPAADNTSSRYRAAFDRRQPTRSQRLQKKTGVTASVKISLYDGSRSVVDSNYNHLDPKHMFAVLEEIQQDVPQRQQPPPSPATPAAPTSPQHDRFGYAIPCRKSSTKSAKPVAYAVVNMAQKQSSNKSTGLEGSEKTDAQISEPAVAATAGTGDEEIEPYATVNLITINAGRQKQCGSTVKQSHTKKEEDDNTGKIPIEPMYAEIAKPGTMATTNQTKDDYMIEPYASVNIPYEYKTLKKHKVSSNTINTPMSTPSRLEMSNNALCNNLMTTVVT